MCGGDFGESRGYTTASLYQIHTWFATALQPDRVSLGGRRTVDGGYRGTDLLNYVKRLWGWTWQVVLRTDGQKGFEVLPRRWVVECTFAWILNARRLSMDYEKTRKSSQSMVYLAMLPLMIRRLN